MKFTPYARQHQRRRDYLDFKAIARSALNNAEFFLRHLLPGGRMEGHEYVALNPRRKDRHLGSFRVNMRTGQWSDFAIKVGGSDLISLVAYLRDITQSAAALEIRDILSMGSIRYDR